MSFTWDRATTVSHRIVKTWLELQIYIDQRYRVSVKYFELVIPVGCVQLWWTEQHISFHTIANKQKNNKRGRFCEFPFKINFHSPKYEKKQPKNSQVLSPEFATGSLSRIHIAKRFIEDFIEHMTSCWPTKLFPGCGDWLNLGEK